MIKHNGVIITIYHMNDISTVSERISITKESDIVFAIDDNGMVKVLKSRFFDTNLVLSGQPDKPSLLKRIINYIRFQLCS